MTKRDDSKIVVWVGSEVLPHEADCRAWLRRTLNPDDLEDVIQEAYCRIAGLKEVSHIGSGRAYLFTTARMVVLERIRRARIVRIETVAEFEQLDFGVDEQSPERIVAGHRELRRVQQLIDGLPKRCGRIFKLRKIEGLSQRDVAELLKLPEHTVEYEVGKGLKLILQAIAEGEKVASTPQSSTANDERTRDSKND